MWYIFNILLIKIYVFDRPSIIKNYIEGYTRKILCVAFSNDFKVLASASKKGDNLI